MRHAGAVSHGEPGAPPPQQHRLRHGAGRQQQQPAEALAAPLRQRQQNSGASRPRLSSAALRQAALPAGRAASVAAPAATLSATGHSTGGQLRAVPAPRPCPERRDAAPVSAQPGSVFGSSAGASSMAATVHLQGGPGAGAGGSNPCGLNPSNPTGVSWAGSALGGSTQAGSAPGTPRTAVTDAASRLDVMSISDDPRPAGGSISPPAVTAAAGEPSTDAGAVAATAAEGHGSAAVAPVTPTGASGCSDGPALARAPLASGSAYAQPATQAAHGAGRSPRDVMSTAAGLPPRTPPTGDAGRPQTLNLQTPPPLGSGCLSGDNTKDRSRRRRRQPHGRRRDSSASGRQRLNADGGAATPDGRRHCTTHPLDGTPASFVRHPLQGACPSTGCIATVRVQSRNIIVSMEISIPSGVLDAPPAAGRLAQHWPHGHSEASRSCFAGKLHLGF